MFKYLIEFNKTYLVQIIKYYDFTSKECYNGTYSKYRFYSNNKRYEEMRDKLKL